MIYVKKAIPGKQCTKECDWIYAFKSMPHIYMRACDMSNGCWIVWGVFCLDYLPLHLVYEKKCQQE